MRNTILSALSLSLMASLSLSACKHDSPNQGEGGVADAGASDSAAEAATMDAGEEDADKSDASDEHDASFDGPELSADLGDGGASPSHLVASLCFPPRCMTETCPPNDLELRRIDVTTGTTSLLVSLAGELTGVVQGGSAYDESSDRLYVGGTNGVSGGRVTTVNTATWTVERTVATAAARVVGFDHDDHLIALDGSDVVEVNPLDGVVTNRFVAEPDALGASFVDRVSNSLYISVTEERDVYFFDRYDLGTGNRTLHESITQSLSEMHRDTGSHLVGLEQESPSGFSLVRIDSSTGASTLISASVASAVASGSSAVDLIARRYYVLTDSGLSVLDMDTGSSESLVSLDHACNGLFVIAEP